jgi:predicted HTH transcriptional regulator
LINNFPNILLHNIVSLQDSKTVVIVKVEQTPKPIFVEDKGEKEFYVRVGNSTKPLDLEAAHNYIGMHW